MSEAERQPYVDMANADRDRYNKDMENYEPVDDEKSTKKRKAKKDPNMPKKPWSSYFFFCDEFRQSVKEKNPELKATEIAKHLGKLWSECGDKTSYENMSKEAKEKYNKVIVKNVIHFLILHLLGNGRIQTEYTKY